jgi:glycosyltransferase involved in cell wall biosynthesis
MNANASEVLRRTAFVVWGFPELTQTFIHRELLELERGTGPVHILAGPRRDASRQDPALRAIAERASYLGPAPLWATRGLAWALRHPLRFARTFAWLIALPHRSLGHRLRAAAMVLAAAALVGEVRARGVRYLHAHFAAYQTELTMALARLCELPWGATFHAVGIHRDRNLLPQKLQGARVVLTCTAHNAEHLRALCPSEAHKVRLVHHGLDLASVGAPTPQPCGSARFVAVGRLVPKKGLSHLIEAMALLKARGLRAELTIIGDGPERGALRALATRRGVAEHVRFAGALGHAQVLATMARSHALVAPSVRDRSGDVDGIPNVVLEAMACARPVVGSDLSGIPEVVEDGVTGLLVPAGDPEHLARALGLLSQDPALRQRLGRAARELIEARFDVHDSAQRQLAALGEAAGLTPPNARPRSARAAA